MRVLWVGKHGGGGAGDEVYDRKLIAELQREGVAITRFAPTRVSRTREVANLARGIPHYRTGFAGAGNEGHLHTAARNADAVVASWEPFDRLAFSVRGKPVIPILHNVTSRSLPRLFPGRLVPQLLARRVDHWERKAYGGDQFAAVAVLSRADEAHVRALRRMKPTVYVPPGMPPCVPLAHGATFRPELVLSGTFDWTPKRRDVIAFAREFAASGQTWPVFADPLPAQAATALQPLPLDAFDPARAIRLGLIPDRFEAGYKLKTTFYLAQNAIVLSYADVSADFQDLDDQGFFIRRIGHASEIPGHVAEIASLPPHELVRRMERFKQRCSERFAWAAAARTLLQALRAVT